MKKRSNALVTKLLMLPFLLIFFTCTFAQETETVSSTFNDSISYIDDNNNFQEYRVLSSIQADEVLSVIGGCKDIVLYCGHDGEVETYMVLCDFWKAEVVNQEIVLSDWYEIWVLGYDLHTGDTICTPIDPSCIWFNKNNSTYNVGNYIFWDPVPRSFPFKWKVPQYTLISCLQYAEEIQLTYHHYIHIFEDFIFEDFVSFDDNFSLPPYYRNVKINTRTNTGNRGFRDFQSAKLQMNSSFTGKKPAGLPGDTISTVKQFDNNQNIQVDSGWRELDTIPKQQAEKVGQQGEKQVNGDKEEKIDHQQTEGVRTRIVQPQDRQVQRQVEQERIQRQLYEHTPTTRPTANPTTNPTTRPTTGPTTRPTAGPATSSTTRPTANSTTKQHEEQARKQAEQEKLKKQQQEQQNQSQKVQQKKKR